MPTLQTKQNKTTNFDKKELSIFLNLHKLIIIIFNYILQPINYKLPIEVAAHENKNLFCIIITIIIIIINHITNMISKKKLSAKKNNDFKFSPKFFLRLFPFQKKRFEFQSFFSMIHFGSHFQKKKNHM